MAALLSFHPNPAHAQGIVVSSSFTNAAGGSWIIGANWDTNPNWPDGIGASASIPSNQTAARTISVNDAITVGVLSITNNTTFANTINNGITNAALEFDATTGPGTISVSGTGTTANTVSANMVLTDSILVNVANPFGNATSGALTLSGTMSGSGGLTKSGTGMLTISTNAKTYTGPTLFDTDTGRTRISSSGSIAGSSSVTVKQGAQITLIASSGDYTLGAVLNLNGTGLGPTSAQGNFPGAIRNDTNLVAVIVSPVVLQTDTLIHVQGSTSGSTTFASSVSGPGKLTLTNPGAGDGNHGQLVLGAASTYTGGTLVNGGTLVASNPASSFGIGNVVVNNALAPDSNAKLTISTGVLNAVGDTATLSLAGGRVFGLADTGYVDLGAGVNEAVGGLILGGVVQGPGTYGSTASLAANKSDEYFSGPGIVTVIPEPGAAVMSIGAFLTVLACRRPRRAA